MGSRCDAGGKNRRIIRAGGGGHKAAGDSPQTGFYFGSRSTRRPLNVTTTPVAP